MAVTPRLGVLASGSGTNLQALIDAVEAGRIGAEVTRVIVNRRGALARSRARQAGIREECRLLGPYLQGAPDRVAARRLYDADLAGAVAAGQPDLVVLAGWMHVLSTVFLDRFPERVVNLHPALPGTFPGANAIEDTWRAYRAGVVASAGVMVHYVVDEGVDDGPVIAAEEVPILQDDTIHTLTERIHRVEHRLLVDSVATLLEGR
ncbi:MAG: phosphoribosylglycinamide formyltransferase [Acidimicrobiia bacterium]|nr:phosphoribosylglycinamide formyltransferase [Acidimicrobiia bacterium]